MLTIQDAVNKIKILIENAIINGGVVEKTTLSAHKCQFAFYMTQLKHHS